MKIAIVAGEASGDLLGAKLIYALRKQYPNVEIEGIGGPAMIAAGCNSLFDIERLAVMGFFEPLRRLPDLIKLRSDLYRHLINNKPDLFIGIDAPDFNLGLELKLKQAAIKVVHYVSPSVWAWRQYRVKKIRRAVDLMLTLLPFENDFYKRHHVPVKYVGHPLAEQIPLLPDKIAARRALCIDENACYVALLPGSRRQEINYMAESFLKAAKIIHQKHPEVKFITAHVNEQRYQEFYEYFKLYAPEIPLEFFTRHSQDVMCAADVVIVTSGTATLEVMLYKKPMVIAYKMSSLTYMLAKLIVKSRFIGLPNLLAREAIVPELIQHDANPTKIAEHVTNYLENGADVNLLVERYKQIHQSMHVNCPDTITSAIQNVLV